MTDLGDPYEGADPRLAWMLRVLSDEFGMRGVLKTQQAAFYYANSNGEIDHRLGPQSDEAPEPDEPHDHGYMGRPRVCATCGQEQPAVDQLKEFIAANDPTVSETQRRARELGLKIDFELITTSPLEEHDDNAPAFEAMTEEAKREYKEALTKDWDTLHAAVYQAVGAASSCWESLEGAGVFDDQRAVLVARSLVEWIEQRYTKSRETSGGPLKRDHEHEDWQIAEERTGERYCAACGQTVPPEGDDDDDDEPHINPHRFVGAAQMTPTGESDHCEACGKTFRDAIHTTESDGDRLARMGTDARKWAAEGVAGSPATVRRSARVHQVGRGRA